MKITIEEKHKVSDYLDAACREVQKAYHVLFALPGVERERELLREAIGSIRDAQHAIEKAHATYINDWTQ